MCPIKKWRLHLEHIPYISAISIALTNIFNGSKGVEKVDMSYF